MLRLSLLAPPAPSPHPQPKHKALLSFPSVSGSQQVSAGDLSHPTPIFSSRPSASKSQGSFWAKFN